MAVIAVMSAKGAPGATTTTLLLATLWPAPTIVLDADPLGGDMSLRMQRSDGRAMDPERGLLSLLPAARRGLDPLAVAQHTQEAVGGQPILAGLPGPEQATAVAPLWPTLADVFARVPTADMFVDVGQVQATSEHMPLVERADLLLVVYRPTAWSALHARRRVESLEVRLRDRGVRVGIVGVADGDQEQDRQTAASAIRSGLSWVHDYGVIAHDPRAVVMFEGQTVYRPERTLLARSGRTVADRMYADLAGAEVDLASPDMTADPALAADAATQREAPGDDAAGQENDAGAPTAVLPGAQGQPSRRGRRRGPRRFREPKGVS